MSYLFFLLPMGAAITAAVALAIKWRGARHARLALALAIDGPAAERMVDRTEAWLGVVKIALKNRDAVAPRLARAAVRELLTELRDVALTARLRRALGTAAKPARPLSLKLRVLLETLWLAPGILAALLLARRDTDMDDLRALTDAAAADLKASVESDLPPLVGAFARRIQGLPTPIPGHVLDDVERARAAGRAVSKRRRP